LVQASCSTNNGLPQWIALNIVKESNPVQVVEYAIARDIADEPVFAWWIPYTLHKCNVIFLAMNSRLWKTSHKYGIELPRSVEEALEID
jgi:hypothetical protein